MERLEVATDVHVDRETVYEFLLSFPLYARYSEYLDGVSTHGEGGPGTEYDLHLSWWRLSHTARSRVTEVEPPERIAWRLVDDLSARGEWILEDARDGADAGDGSDDAEPTTRVRLVVQYDPSSADALGASRLLSVGALVDRLAPIARAEARHVVERIVADLEGEQRPVELEVLDRPGD